MASTLRETLALASRLVKRQLRARGPIESEVVNDTFDEIHADDIAIIDQLNRFLAQSENDAKITSREVSTLRDRLAELERRDTIRQFFDAENGGTLEFTSDFRDLTPIQTTQFNVERRLRVNPLFGQVTVPYNGYRSRFHAVEVRSGKIFIPDTLIATVAEVGEFGGTVTPGTPKNAFNGQNESYWQRVVEFDLANDVDAVSARIDVDVPIRFAQKANVFTINPYPLGQVDIVSVLYSVDASDPAIPLPGFPSAGINNAKATRLYFPPTDITRLRVILRQRNWVPREGKKHFSYGAQEIDLALVEFDKTNELSLKDNNIALLKVDAPTGFNFKHITNFFSDPAPEVGGSPTGVFFEVYSDANLSSLQWASVTSTDPTVATPIDLESLAISTVYVLVGLKYQTSEQNTPVLENMGFAYTVTT